MLDGPTASDAIAVLDQMEAPQNKGGKHQPMDWRGAKLAIFDAAQSRAKVSMFDAIQAGDGPDARMVVIAETSSGHLVRIPLTALELRCIARAALDGKHWL